MPNCIPPVFEIGVERSPMDCLFDLWLETPHKTPHCSNGGCDNGCTPEPPRPPEGWKDCPDGFEPDWEARWCMLTDRYPSMKCLPPERLQDLWERALCTVNLNCLHCPATARALIESLILHFWEVEAYYASAVRVAYAVSASKGKVNPVVPPVNKSGGGVDGSAAYYGMTVWGVQFQALQQTVKAPVTGIYFARAKVTSSRRRHH